MQTNIKELHTLSIKMNSKKTKTADEHLNVYYKGIQLSSLC